MQQLASITQHHPPPREIVQRLKTMELGAHLQGVQIPKQALRLVGKQVATEGPRRLQV